MRFGIDYLLADDALRYEASGYRVALMGHPASLTRDGTHSLTALMADDKLRPVAAFGPQHGMLGDKQDNMVESDDYRDERFGIPVFSLYGQVRRPTAQMMETFDLLLFDLQDIGTRIYTYVTTLAYLLEDCARDGKSLWVLDRPNPVGRPVEGTLLEAGWESFVGAAAIPMRHGLTVGEFAAWYVEEKNLDIDLRIVRAEGYDPSDAPGFGWPLNDRPWVNPSPNASSLNMARCFPGTVLFEGTQLSEGRGTTVALEMVGAPDIDADQVLSRMRRLAPEWLEGCFVRPCFFEPTFHKHARRLCQGIQLHTDCAGYQHDRFRPYRIAALILKSIRLEYPDYDLWRVFDYEYETDRLAIDLLSGGTLLRDWVDDPTAEAGELDEHLDADERGWIEAREPYLLY